MGAERDNRTRGSLGHLPLALREPQGERGSGVSVTMRTRRPLELLGRPSHATELLQRVTSGVVDAALVRRLADLADVDVAVAVDPDAVGRGEVARQTGVFALPTAEF